MWEQKFGERLSRLRIQHGVSARDMSLSLGQAPSYINRIENSKSFPSMSSFFYICEYLHITPTEFFNLELSSPRHLQKLSSELRRLTPSEMDHLLLIAQDINSRK